MLKCCDAVTDASQKLAGHMPELSLLPPAGERKKLNRGLVGSDDMR
jgi:hypothetical protein